MGHLSGLLWSDEVAFKGACLDPIHMNAAPVVNNFDRYQAGRVEGAQENASFGILASGDAVLG